MSDQPSEICNRLVPILERKRNLALSNIPPPRFDIVSPYPQYSAFQLNMRRKVEILKYTNSRQNTKTNDLTKNQKYANLLKKTNKISEYQINQPYSNRVCKEDVTIPTLSTLCDVPGPPIILQYDPLVPLYNYGNNVQSYGIINQESTINEL